MKQTRLKHLTIAAMLCALGITIPMFMPKLALDQFATYTLAAHVPVMIASFISPFVAIFVALGTAIGFFFTSLPVVGFRALSHLLWAVPMAFLLSKNIMDKQKISHMSILCICVAFIHALFETLVVIIMMPAIAQNGFWMLMLYGLGYVAHSCVDFFIAYLVYKALSRAKML